MSSRSSSTSATPPRDRLAHLLAVWFGCGYVPRAPGTAGTLGALPLYFLVRPHGVGVVLLTAAAVAATGVWAGSVVAARTGLEDPQIVVIDEVAGVLTALAAAPEGWAGTAAGVVLFRVFDQLKPWPAGAAEKLPGGLGIVLDDVFAGAWAAAVLMGLRWVGALAR
jgi:phosphatidylglycerophosphatase A